MSIDETTKGVETPTLVQNTLKSPSSMAALFQPKNTGLVRVINKDVITYPRVKQSRLETGSYSCGKL